MSETARLVDELERDHSGDAWHGSPVTTILDGVTAAQAATRAMPHVHTVWELVLHMTAWKNEARRRLAGAPAGQPLEGDWPSVGETTADRWAGALDGLHAAHAALASAVRDLPESRLFEATNDTRDPESAPADSYYVLLHGIVQHDAYHAGQIALLLKALRGNAANGQERV